MAVRMLHKGNDSAQEQQNPWSTEVDGAGGSYQIQVFGSMIATPGSPRLWPNAVRIASSALRMMKSTTSTGVKTDAQALMCAQEGLGEEAVVERAHDLLLAR